MPDLPTKTIEIVASIDAAGFSEELRDHYKSHFLPLVQKLWPGQYLRVRMTLRSMKDAIVIPQAAIILRGNDRQVYVVGPDRTAQLKPVKLRYAFGEMAVVDGVDAGASVVLDGKQNLRPGTPLRTQPAAVDPAAAARLAAASAAAGGGASGNDVAAP